MKKVLQIFSSNYFIFIYFILFELAFTYPVIFHLKTLLIACGDFADSYQHIWGFWWFKYALEALHTNPFFTNYLHWPLGAPLVFQTWSLTNVVVSIPLQSLVGKIANFNILMILSVSLTGFTTYLLALYLIKNKLASFLAGFFMMTSPYIMTHSQGHLEVTAFEFVPLFLLYFFKMREGVNDWKLPAIFLVLSSLTDWYNLFYLIIFLIIYFLYERLKFDRQFWLNFLKITIFSLIFLSPILFTMIYIMMTDKMIVEHNSVDFSTDLLAFFIPNHPSRFLAPVTQAIYEKWEAWWQNVGYLGYSTLILAIYAICKLKSKQIYFWAFIALFFGLLSMGPFLHINGVVTKLPMPYYAIEKILPFSYIMGLPTMATVMMYLGLAMLSAFALKNLLTVKNKSAIILIVLVIILALFERWPKIPITSVYVPIFYSELSKMSDDFAIIDISNESSAKILYYQTIHHKKLIGGYTSRRTEKMQEFLYRTPVITDILVRPLPTTDPQKAKEVLNSYQIKFILTQPGPQNLQTNDLLTKTYGLPIYFQDHDLIVYQVF